MDLERLNGLADSIFETLLAAYNERGLEGDMTLVLSCAYTCANYGINLGLAEGSPEDVLLTEYVNARINAYNESRKSSQSL